MKRKKTKASEHKDIDAILAEGTLIDEALAQGVQEALRRHKQAGLPIAVWREGKVVWIPPEQIELRDASDNQRLRPR